jgi:hypothetical protein
MSDTGSIVGSCATIEEELQALRDHIRAHRTALNDEGVWLFLATLGCWSVSWPPPQLFAYGFAVWLFGARISERSKETRPFSKLVSTLQERIGRLATSEMQRKAGLFDLLEVQKQELSVFAPFRQVRAFLVCWVFWSGSFLYGLYQALPVRHAG